VKNSGITLVSVLAEANLDHVAVGRLCLVAGLGQTFAGVGQGPVGAVAGHEGRVVALGVDDGVLDAALAGAQPAEIRDGLVHLRLVQSAKTRCVTVVPARALWLHFGGRLGVPLGVPAHLQIKSFKNNGRLSFSVSLALVR